MKPATAAAIHLMHARSNGMIPLGWSNACTSVAFRPLQGETIGVLVFGLVPLRVPGRRRFPMREAATMQTSGWVILDTVVAFMVAMLAKVQAAAEAVVNAVPGRTRGTRPRGNNSRGGQATALKAAANREEQQRAAGNDQRAPQGPSGIRGHVWTAWVGDIRMKRNEGRREPVLCALVDLPAGQYGTQTPGSPEYLALVCPGLAL